MVLDPLANGSSHWALPFTLQRPHPTTPCPHACPVTLTLRSKGNFADMFLKLLRDEGAEEEWRVFAACEGELPTAEQLAEFDGFVVTGSV